MIKQHPKEMLVDLIARFTEYSAKHLPDDILDRLRVLRAMETTDSARIIYDAMFENIDMAHELSRPVC
ncbi:MAG: fumarate hydratase, partial [Clostridiales bacterium]|nr:fumarate hydratase [Clostridiales bacterium]